MPGDGARSRGLIREVPAARRCSRPPTMSARNLWYWPDIAGHDRVGLRGGPAPPTALPFTIDADAQPEPPGGLPKGGVTRLDLPNRHLEYAVTWYGLALTLIGVYLAFAVGRLRLFAGHSVAAQLNVYLGVTRPAALFGPCLRPRVAKVRLPFSSTPRSRSRALHQYQRRSPGTRVRGRAAGRSGPRRRPLRAEDLAAARARRHRRASPASPTPRSPPRDGARSSAAPCRAASCWRSAREAYARFGHPAVTPLVQIGANAVGAGAVPRADAGLQGRGHAGARAPDGPRARPRGERAHHRRRHLGRHRRRGHRGLPRLQAHRRHHPVPERPRVRRAAAHDDDRRASPTCMRSPSTARSTIARRW